MYILQACVQLYIRGCLAEVYKFAEECLLSLREFFLYTSSALRGPILKFFLLFFFNRICFLINHMCDAIKYMYILGKICVIN